MYVYVCMCMYMYVYVCICMYMYAYVCVCMYVMVMLIMIIMIIKSYEFHYETLQRALRAHREGLEEALRGAADVEALVSN